MTYEPDHLPRFCRLRQALALPFYAVALLMSFASSLLGNIAAKIDCEE